MTTHAPHRPTKPQREPDVSSEGVITHPLAPHQERRRFQTYQYLRLLFGLGCLLVGLTFLFLRRPMPTLDWFISLPIAILSGIFFAIAAYKQELGLYFPASILAGLSVGLLFLTIAGAAPIILGLSGGFFLLLLITRWLRLENMLWLLFPAICLFLTGIFLFTIT